MKMTMKTEKVLEAYNILKAATYQKLDDDDKIKLWKIARTLKPVATKFEEDSKDAAEKLKPEGFDEILQKAQEYEQKKQKGDTDLPMTEEEYQQFLKGDWSKFNGLIAKAVKDFAEKEVELNFEPLSESAFTKLMASNNWEMQKAMTLGELIVE